MKQHHWAIFAGLCFAAVHAAAATGDPADASAVVPPTIYPSPFADYQVLGADTAKPWKEANDTVRTIGGWRAYAKEAAESAKAKAANARPAAPGARAAPPTPPVPNQHPHGGLK